LFPSFKCCYSYDARDDTSLIIVLETDSELAVARAYLTIT